MHIRLINVYLLKVPGVSSPYFNKIKGTSHLVKRHTLSLEILVGNLMPRLVFFCVVGLPLFGKEGSGTPIFKILVRALAFVSLLTFSLFYRVQEKLVHC